MRQLFWWSEKVFNYVYWLDTHVDLFLILSSVLNTLGIRLFPVTPRKIDLKLRDQD